MLLHLLLALTTTTQSHPTTTQPPILRYAASPTATTLLTDTVPQTITLFTSLATSTNLNGSSTTVAIADAGIDGNLCPLVGKVRDVDDVPVDAHGSAVASLVLGGDGADEAGGGLAYGADGVFLHLPRGANVSSLLSTLDDAVAADAHMFVAAVGTPAPANRSYSTVARDLDAWTANHSSVLVVLPATIPGEADGDAGTTSSLATAKNVLSVSASAVDGSVLQGDQLTPLPDGRTKPDVTAPGVDIAIVDPDATECGVTVRGTGSSYATALVAGAAALVRDYFVQGYYPRGWAIPSTAFVPSSALLRAVMLHATLPTDGGARAARAGAGAGQPVLDRVLRLCNESAPADPCSGDAEGFRSLLVADDKLMLSTGAYDRTCLVVPEGASYIAATIAWTDPPGDTAAAFSLVNDIDAALFNPSGAEYRGGGGASFDRLNNAESIVVTNPRPGQWTLGVGAARILSAQRYSLVLTGDFAAERCVDAATAQPVHTYCPLGCSGPFAGVCNGGTCQCTGNGRRAMDCSAAGCAGSCGLRGTCDNVRGTCICSPGYTGELCDVLEGDVDPPEILTTEEVLVEQGVPIAEFAGVMVALYCAGAICAVVCGATLGVKWLEHKRDSNVARG